MSPVFVAERSTSNLVSQLGVNGDDFAGPFNCAVYTPNVPVTVEAGDVLGACVFNPSGGDNKQLDIVGNRLTSLGMLMKTGVNGCGMNTVPSTVTSTSLQDSSSLVLHLYANIVPLSETQPPPTTTMATTMESTSAPVTTAATTMATTMETVPVTTMATTMESAPVTTAPTTMATTMETAPVTTAATTMVTTIVTGSKQSPLASEPTSILDTTTEDQSLSTFSQSSDAGMGAVGDSAGTIVPIVVVVLALLVASVAIFIVIIILWTRKRRLTKKSYTVAGVGTSEDPDINVKSNDAYGVSSGVGQSADTDYVYSTVIIHEAESNRVGTTANIEMRPIQGTRTEDSEANMSTNEAYVVSGDVGQTENNDHEYITIPEQTHGDEYDYVDNHL